MSLLLSLLWICVLLFSSLFDVLFVEAAKSRMPLIEEISRKPKNSRQTRKFWIKFTVVLSIYLPEAFQRSQLFLENY